MNISLTSNFAEFPDAQSSHASNITDISVEGESVDTCDHTLRKIQSKGIQERVRKSIESVSSISGKAFDFRSKTDQGSTGSNLTSDQGLQYSASSGTSINLYVDSTPDLHPEREALKDEVQSLLDHAGTDNWDGEGAAALSPKIVAIAVELAGTFPAGIDRPMISATPHGEIDFDWSLCRDIMLTVSVGPCGDIAFAGLFNETELNGKELWEGELPHFVMCCFKRLKMCIQSCNGEIRPFLQ